MIPEPASVSKLCYKFACMLPGTCIIFKALLAVIFIVGHIIFTIVGRWTVNASRTQTLLCELIMLIFLLARPV